MKTFKVLVGVTGGIAAYKACELVRLFVRGGHEVRVAMTKSATEFVTPLTFEVLSGNPVPRGLFAARADPAVEHVETAAWADGVVIAPATANVIGKLAAGIADDMLTTLLLAVPAPTPVLLAPAMNTRMWDNPMVRRNIETLLTAGGGRFVTVGPVVKELACGDLGMGGMAPVEELFRRLIDMLEKRTFHAH